MKFLLVAVNAKYIHSNPAIYSLRSYAGPVLQPHIELAEYTINQHVQDILGDIYRKKPEAIGFSCYIWNWNLIQELLTELPKLLPGADIWLGGPEVSFDASEILARYPQVKGIMIGEGEATFRELLEYYVSTEPMQKEQISHERQQKEMLNIPGLCLHTGYTPARELLDMNLLPFLYGNLESFENRIIYYESSRGCPYRCSYCLSSIDKKVRLRDSNKVKQELQFFLDHQVQQVKFVDRTFNIDHGHAMEIWQFIMEHDNGVTNFHFEIAADILREDELVLLSRMRPGLVQLEIGVQSANPDTLRAVHRAPELEVLEQNVAALGVPGNIHLHLDLIAGLPCEDYASFGRSFDRVYRMRPEQLQLGFLKVLKGSEMHAKAEEYGIRYLDRPPYEVLYTRWLSYDDILRLKKIEEMVELYYNSNQYTHTLPYLERQFAGPFAMYEAMTDFFEEKGYFVNSPARAHRYEILLQFACAYDPGHEAVYRELLTYDMYLRENLKSRPGFAGELSVQDREVIRSCYQKEEETRQLLPNHLQYDWKQLSKMTHLEPFVYPVWDVEKMISSDADKNDKRVNFVSGEACYVLFDYSRRNPLTKEAYVQIV